MKTGILKSLTKEWPLFVTAALGLIGLQFSPTLIADLQYDRAAIASGEVWRLLTGHFVHWSWEHLFWDALVFLGVGFFIARESISRFVFVTITSSLLISGAVWFFLPEMQLYRGLSGIDSALFTCFMTMLWQRARCDGDTTMAWLSIAGIVLFLLKSSVYELATGQTIFVSFEENIVSVPLAHLIGGAWGVALVLFWSTTGNWDTNCRESDATSQGTGSC
jgi:rhomboid family GlyGly-CTERM serine protease